MNFQGKTAAVLCMLLLAPAMLAPAPASAAVINYGNFVAPGGSVSFLNVAESSGTDSVPLFGPPTVFPVGLDFNPTSFVASSSGGSGPDVTDGQLNVTLAGGGIHADPVTIDSISLFERGDFSLLGTGTPATQALAGLSMLLKITEIDGLPVTPILLPSAHSSVAFNLLASPGLLQPWSLSSTVDVRGKLVSSGIPFIHGVTRLEAVFDDNLVAISEGSSLAFIAKKDFVLEVTTRIAPEPATAALAAIGLLAAASRPTRRRRLACEN